MQHHAICLMAEMEAQLSHKFVISDCIVHMPSLLIFLQKCTRLIHLMIEIYKRFSLCGACPWTPLEGLG